MSVWEVIEVETTVLCAILAARHQQDQGATYITRTGRWTQVTIYENLAPPPPPQVKLQWKECSYVPTNMTKPQAVTMVEKVYMGGETENGEVFQWMYIYAYGRTIMVCMKL